MLHCDNFDCFTTHLNHIAERSREKGRVGRGSARKGGGGKREGRERGGESNEVCIK